ncbi:FG-GAP repeat protein [Streptomyces sp. CB09001]|uniref:FG-GAP repeat protein n=1 Tax=Streptomyces sp. CB09001 TaxID=2083284 RepID=UPI001F078FAB|nr:FG-GAP repeat protein [Streptomyces sp. CB09001]
MGGGAVVVALAVAAGLVIADDGPAGIASPYDCGTGGGHGTATAAPGSDRPASEGTADFDGDGHPDLVLGGPADVEGAVGGGSIEVVYGAGEGAGTARCQFLTQDDAGIPGKSDYEAFFGAETVARDFDGDGYSDLAVTVLDSGSGIIIMWGSEEGLSRAARVPGTDVSHVAWDNDGSLNESLVAGDFDGDGHCDLVFGLGSDKGLLKGPFGRDGDPAGTGRVRAPRRPSADVELASYVDLVAGDLDGDGIDDLVSFHNADTKSEVNRPVSYLRGGRNGFTQPEGTRLPDADTGAIGDVDGDGIDDLVLNPFGGDPSRSSVTVAYGSEDGPGERTTTVDQNTPGVPGDELREQDVVFESLDTGDVNGDGYEDVVAGAPRWDLDGNGEPGPEYVLFLAGGPEGLSGAGARLFDGRDLGAAPGGDADFGAAVGLTDLDGDGLADLVVTAPGSGTVDSVTWLLSGTTDGPSAEGVARLSADTFEDAGPDTAMGLGGIAHRGFRSSSPAI